MNINFGAIFKIFEKVLPITWNLRTTLDHTIRFVPQQLILLSHGSGETLFKRSWNRHIILIFLRLTLIIYYPCHICGRLLIYKCHFYWNKYSLYTLKSPIFIFYNHIVRNVPVSVFIFVKAGYAHASSDGLLFPLRTFMETENKTNIGLNSAM